MQELLDTFQQRFGAAPQTLAAAPGRLEILGNHTDYNEGVVLSCAVDRRTVVALAPNGSRRVRFYDLRAGQEGEFALDNLRLPLRPKWLGYPAGVVSELARRGATPGGFDAVLTSDVPLSAGMSSSAALETAILLALCAAFHLEFSREELARIGQGVENNFLGLKTGLLDQFSSIFGMAGRMILSDFRTVKVTGSAPLAPGYAILVVNSMRKHNLVDSAYNERRFSCEEAARKLRTRFPAVKTLRDVTSAMLADSRSILSEKEFRRASHVVGECERVQRAMALLEQGDMTGFGALWFASHASSRENFENSAPELDFLVDCAQNIPGCLGARLSGGGFGGITIHLVAEAMLEPYREEIQAKFRARYDIVPETIVCRAGQGAAVLPVPQF